MLFYYLNLLTVSDTLKILSHVMKNLSAVLIQYLLISHALGLQTGFFA